ncbi:MAG: hypothetical protein CVU00_09370 [Bacteroidetes bacterium HGW-Bacteroidetes-17]|jgi:putative ABC transport system permease protein|nr:MAG: hypothetical protein CVU00_09370 [Bacteroidetes bacterium HGW-Bacteroidetes-17]
MIKHSFKIIWNQKKKNAYIISELFILFIVLLISSIYLIEKYELYTGGVGANIEDTFYLNLREKDGQRVDYKEKLKNMLIDLESLPDVKKVSYSYFSIPYIWSMSRSYIKYDSLQVSAVLREADENFAEVLGIKVLAGHWLENDYEGANPQIVIDILVAEKLFGSIDKALNKVVKFNGEKQVVGVYEKLKRNEYETNYPSCFFLLDQTNMMGVDVVLKCKDGKMVPPSQISKIIFSYFSKDDYVMRYASTMEAKKREVNSGKRNEIVMVSFVAVFLVINIILGMIGIFGYSVKRRKAELGLRRAVGSSASKIHYLLLLESWTLTLFALIPAILITVQIPLLDLYPVETALFIKALCLSIVLIFVFVSISVYYPGYMASKVQASEALQEE